MTNRVERLLDQLQRNKIDKPEFLRRVDRIPTKELQALLDLFPLQEAGS